MDQVKVRLGERSYRIYLGNGILKNTADYISGFARGERVGVITNPKIKNLFGKKIASSLKKAGFKHEFITIPDGEKYKTLAAISRIYDRLVAARFDRADTILALGGGVVGDMAGFAAGTYMRGIDYVQIPTTLLAQVDSSVGGKTGVDHKKGKNLIGAFHQPKAVVCDMAALKSLSDREYRCGLAEVIKYGVIRSASLFRFMEESVEKVLERKNKTLLRIVKESCRIKARVVEEDEREGGIRAILNYGHTFAHGIETALNYKKIKHGEAVAIGMVMAANLSYSAGFSSAADAGRIENLVKAYGLPTRLPKGLDSKRVIDGMGHDKKVLSGKRRLIVFGKIGRALICENPPLRKISESIENKY